MTTTKCTQCSKSFSFNKKSIRFYYFHKTLYFCSNKCYFAYSKQNNLTYRQWIKKYASLTKTQKEKYAKNLKKVSNQINKLKQKYGNNKALQAQHDLILTKPVKPANWFNHISEYKSFNEFKKAVIKFLKKDTLKSISDDSWNFFIHNSYERSSQLKQIKAINKVFDEVYGKSLVRWGFFEQDDQKPENNKFWGPYIVVKEESFFLDMQYIFSLNTFIKKRLKK